MLMLKVEKRSHTKSICESFFFISFPTNLLKRIKTKNIEESMRNVFHGCVEVLKALGKGQGKTGVLVDTEKVRNDLKHERWHIYFINI